MTERITSTSKSWMKTLFGFQVTVGRSSRDLPLKAAPNQTLKVNR